MTYEQKRDHPISARIPRSLRLDLEAAARDRARAIGERPPAFNEIVNSALEHELGRLRMPIERPTLVAAQ